MFYGTLEFQNIEPTPLPGVRVQQARLKGAVLLLFGGNVRTAVIVPDSMVPYPNREPTEAELDELTAEEFEAWADDLDEALADSSVGQRIKAIKEKLDAE